MAKARISLGQADRDRLGGPEWLDVDTEDIDIDELIEIEEGLGLDLVTFLDGWPRGPRTMKGIVWLGLRRAGVEIPLADLHFKAFADARYRKVAPEAEASPGKDPEEPGEDSPSTPPTDSPTL